MSLTPEQKNLAKFIYDFIHKNGQISIESIAMSIKEYEFQKYKYSLRLKVIANSTPEPMSGCWIWDGCIKNNGYGSLMFRVDGKERCISAHRTSYEVFKEKIPEGLLIRHTCDVKSCVNPSHLIVGTQKENMDDMIKRGRSKAFSIRCKNGHLLDKGNIRMVKYGDKKFRSCITCARIGALSYYYRQKEKYNAN